MDGDEGDFDGEDGVCMVGRWVTERDALGGASHIALNVTDLPKYPKYLPDVSNISKIA